MKKMKFKINKILNREDQSHSNSSNPKISKPDFLIHTNYSSFLNTNILEVYNKNTQKRVQLYPRNAYQYK